MAAAPSAAGAIKKQATLANGMAIKASARNYGVGGAIQPKRDLSRFVRWPRYIRLQRQRKVLNMRLKVPPAIAQFSRTLDLNTATNVFNMLDKYQPEEKAAKKERLLAKAGGADKGGKPYFVKCGINHVTSLIENKKASLVVIAHDVDPVETIVWMPALCRQMDVPYCIVKGKARLGKVVHMKTATCLALTDIKQEDKPAFAKLVKSIKANFNDKYDEEMRKWGGGIMGVKSIAKTSRQDKIVEAERRKKEGL